MNPVVLERWRVLIKKLGGDGYFRLGLLAAFGAKDMIKRLE